MEWIKIPTDEILLSDRADWQNLSLIKYMALYCQLEIEPTEIQLRRVLNKKQFYYVSSNKQLVLKLIQSGIEVVSNKRRSDKHRYDKKSSKNNGISEIPQAERTRYDGTDKIRLDKIREEEIKENYIIIPQIEKYAFEGEVIKLDQKDWENWLKAYPELNLYAECLVRDEWLQSQPPEEQKKWFISTSKYFVKQNDFRKKQHEEQEIKEYAF